MFCDQSGFYLLPMVVRTYAPVGKTPILKENLTRDHLSAMSAITLEGKLYMLEQERAFKGEDVVRFLKHLMRQIEGKLLIIWDGSPIHRGGAVKDFLASGAAVQVESATELGTAVLDLLTDAARRDQMIASAHAILQANRGARARLLALSEKLLPR